jgi:hypothetical protein
MKIVINIKSNIPIGKVERNGKSQRVNIHTYQWKAALKT